MSRSRTRLALCTALLVLPLAASLHGPSVPFAATSTVTVTVEVPSATSIDVSGCGDGVPGVTNFGTVLPGAAAITAGDCVVAFGSSNDTAALHMRQRDGLDRAMYRFAHGPLAPSFSGDGEHIEPAGTGADELQKAVVQPDGKLVAVGIATSSNDDTLIVRYTRSGGLDGSFGGTGKLVTAIGDWDDRLHDVTLQDDGKIVSAGTGYFSPVQEMIVQRHNSDGTLDPTFDTDGWQRATALPRSTGRDVAIQADGKIVVAGYADDGTQDDIAVARFNADGSPDTSFGGGDGVLTTLVGEGTSMDRGYAVAVQPDGKIVVGGISYVGRYHFVVVRYLADGTLDTTFDGDGKYPFALGSTNDHAFAMSLQDDGKFLLAGFSHNGTDTDLAVARVLPGGGLDTSFGGGDGFVTYPSSAGDDRLEDLHVLDDGSIIAAGRMSTGTRNEAVVLRFTKDGLLDTAFGVGGVGRYPGAGATNSSGSGIAPDADGRAYLAGTATVGGNAETFAALLDSSTVPDWDAGVNDWSAGTGTFAICLHTLANGTGSWTVAGSGNCTTAAAGNWNAGPTTIATKTAATTTAGQTATAAFRFGVRMAASQPPGNYRAPLSWEVVAPAV